ncbi:helix-turn-helix domain-containing protein [Actinobacillus capsulatus]|uniref:helix-turn-helix domain-containing protein n=1 Tax=Actinobacillus capsulatus TaxID=717 RepID=UPI000380619B|nr:helix-turn-helix transcriptional regulator [Actinobacillus capsulatus]
MGINLRLRSIIEQLNLNLTKFSEQSGIPYRSLHNYLRNEREPNSESYMKLAQMGININWLLTGEGDMFVEGVSKLPNAEADTLTTEEASLIDDFRNMNNQGKVAVKTTARAMAQQELFKNSKVG